MKKILCVILALIICTSAAAFAAYEDAPADFTAAWNFDEINDDGTIKDLGTKGYNGKIRNAAYTTVNQGGGIIGNSLNVNPASASTKDSEMNAKGLSHEFTDKSAITFAGWFKSSELPSSFNKEQYIMTMLNTAGGNGIMASITTSGTLKMQFRTTNATSGGIVSATTSTNYKAVKDSWQHYAFTIQLPETSDGTATISIYLNGVQVKTDNKVNSGGLTTFAHLQNTSSNDFRLGGSGSGMYRGDMDEIRLYSRVLSGEEIAKLAANPQTVEPKLLASYDFSNVSGKTVVNSASEGLDGIISSDNLEIAPGYRGQGLHAKSNVTSNNYLSVPGLAAALDGSSAITVTGWFNPDSLPSAGNNYMFFNILTNSGSSNVGGFQAYIDKDTHIIKVGARSAAGDSMFTMTSDYEVTETNKWHHYAFVVDYDNPKYSGAYIGLFVDGAQVRWTNTAGFSGKVFNAGTPIENSALFAGSGWQTFMGTSDEIKVYNYRLTPAEIAAMAADVRIETALSSLKIGGNECIDLDGLMIADKKSDFGAILDVTESQTGITYEMASENGKVPEIMVNGEAVANPERIVLNIGDEVLLTLEGDAWEATKYHKVIIGKKDADTAELSVTNKYGRELSYLEAGETDIALNIRSNNKTIDFILFAALYDQNKLVDISSGKISLTAGRNGKAEASITVPENYNGMTLKVLLTDINMTPYMKAALYSQENVTVSDIIMPSVFASDSIFQRNQPINVWGKAPAGETVTVSFGGETASAQADFKGDFMAVLPAMEANKNPQTLTVSCNELTKQFDNILIGDIWLCGGQSNMAWSISNVDGSADIIAAADYPEIRLFSQALNAESEPMEDVLNGKWAVCTPDTVKRFSGVGYLFGRELYENVDVPIGLISASYGGSRCEAWLTYETLMSREDFKALDSRLSATDIRRPSYLYNAMINPLINYNISGMIFYQGEANTYDSSMYKDLFEALASDFRTAWNNDFPIIYAQISAYDTPYAAEDWPGVRDAQLKCEIPNSAMVVTLDIGEQSNIHPVNKLPVAQRMARAARAMAYGQNIEYKSPAVESVAYNNGSATVTFKDVGAGLKTENLLSGFEVLVNDTWTAADAVYEGTDKITVTSVDGSEITGVRYAWSNFPEACLFAVTTDGFELPASPFSEVK